MMSHLRLGSAKWSCIALACLLCPTASVPGPMVTLNLKDDEVVADITKVVAMPVSDASIVKVEFSVNDVLRATVVKTPYEYKWDTVDEDEGRHTVMVSVYDSDGRSARKRVKVDVDNQLTRGVKFHAERGLDFFWKGDYEKANLEGRKAYKINLADHMAVKAYAAGLGGKGDYSKAITLLEVVQRVNNQPVSPETDYPLKDRAAMELRGFFRVMRAEKQAKPADVIADLNTAYDFWRKLFPSYVDDVRKQFPDSDLSAEARLGVGDSLYYHGDYAGALAEYEKVPPSSPRRLAAEHRRILALSMVRRFKEAEDLGKSIQSEKRDTDTTQALMASLYLRLRQTSRAKEIVDTFEKSTSPVAWLIGYYVDEATENYGRATDFLNRAQLRARPTMDVQYALATYYLDLRDLVKASSALFAALRQNPGMTEVYSLRGYQLAALLPTEGFKQGLQFFDLAVEQDSRNLDARLGKAICYNQLKRYRQADEIMKDLLREDRSGAEVWMVSAATKLGLDDIKGANDGLAMARQLAPDRFKDILVPPMPNLVNRVARLRRLPLITPFLLDVEEKNIQFPKEEMTEPAKKEGAQQ